MREETRENLRQITEKRGVSLSDDAVRKFALYCDLLQEWNGKMNLTAITSEEDVVTRHFLDSVSPLFLIKDEMQALCEKSASLIDVGTGAGFPGVPLAIVLPGLKITLADSLHKRIGFLELVKRELQLENIVLLEGRAEELAHKQELRERFDLATARAVAELSVLSEYVLPFVKPDGLFLAYKGSRAVDEAANAQRALEVLGGSTPVIIPYELQGYDAELSLVQIKKINTTPEKYPRRAGIPSKRPL